MIRPTSDRAREGLFNIIGNQVIKAEVLDLFCGTGALGVEALSRGAQSAVFVDHLRSSIELTKKNIEICGFSERSIVIKRDLRKGLFFLNDRVLSQGFSLVFLDPPYERGLASKVLFDLSECDIINPAALIVAEVRSNEMMLDPINDLKLKDTRRYGDTAFWFYQKGE